MLLINKKQQIRTVFWEGKSIDSVNCGAVQIFGKAINPGYIFRNKKTGNNYVVLTAFFDANEDGDIKALTPFVLYKRTDSMIPTIWARKASEFVEKFDFTGKYEQELKFVLSKSVLRGDHGWE